MFKRLTICALGLGSVMMSVAAPLTPEQALSRAGKSAALKSVGKVVANPVLKYSFKGNDGEAVAYAFEQANGKGYLILSADDIAYPVLGYSDNGQFDMNNIPVQMKSWIEGYSSEIEFAKSRGITSETGNLKSATRADHAAIAPMIKTKWDQGEPYNGQCPEVGGRHCYTGCVATSMSQVMNYFKYPEKGTGILQNSSGGVMSSMNLSDEAFDWSNMLDNYVAGTYNDTQAAAVAYLMKACGYAVGMSYGLDASGASSQNIVKALVNNFLYDPGMTFEGRISYSASEWDEKIYNNLKSGSPIIYNGNDGSVGHSFICDGYDGDGYYHFNWGWSGMSDGYFTLNALNPEALGTGGGEGGGFNFLQGAVLNIRKPGGEPVETQQPQITVYGLPGVTSTTIDGLKRTVVSIGLLSGYGQLTGWRNESAVDFTVRVGAIFENETTGETITTAEGQLGNMYSVSLSAGAYYQGTLTIKVSVPSDLPDGDYKMVLASQNTRVANAPWVPMAVPFSYPNYVRVSKHGGVVTATSVEAPKLTISNFELVGNLYYTRALNVKFTVKNDTDYELTDAISVWLKQNGQGKFKSSNVLVTVPAHSEVEQNWSMLLYRQDGQAAVTSDTEFDVDVVNEFSGESLGQFGKVTMRPNPGTPTVQMRSFTIEGAASESVEIGNMKLTALVVDSGDFDAAIKIRVTKGYFDYKVFANISQLAPGATSLTQTIPVKDKFWEQQVELNTGDETTLTIPVSFSDFVPGEIYNINCKYLSVGQEKSIGTLRFKVAGGSGVNDILDDADNAEVEYYNLQGVKVTNPNRGDMLIMKKGDKTSKIVY